MFCEIPVTKRLYSSSSKSIFYIRTALYMNAQIWQTLSWCLWNGTLRVYFQYHSKQKYMFYHRNKYKINNIKISEKSMEILLSTLHMWFFTPKNIDCGHIITLNYLWNSMLLLSMPYCKPFDTGSHTLININMKCN